MGGGYSYEVLPVRSLSRSEREGHAAKIFAIAAPAFRQLDRRMFTRALFESPAEYSEVIVYKVQEHCVGYVALHFFEREFPGGFSTIMRAEAVLVPRLQRRAALFFPALRRVLRYRVQRPFRKFGVLGAFVSPFGYALAAKYAPVLWPRVGLDTPPDVERTLGELGDAFGLERINGNTLIRYVGWRMDEVREPIRNGHARYFTEMNPYYPAGYGLLTLIPVPYQAMVRGTARFVTGLLSGNLTVAPPSC